MFAAPRMVASRSARSMPAGIVGIADSSMRARRSSVISVILPPAKEPCSGGYRTRRGVARRRFPEAADRQERPARLRAPQTARPADHGGVLQGPAARVGVAQA